MARIFPFQAYRYNPQQVDLSRVVTQPYDKITVPMHKRYYELDPHNLVRVERGRVEENDTLTNNVYTRAGRTLDDWIASGVLLRDAAPSVYIYSQTYLMPGTRTRHERTGIIALGAVEDYSAGMVFRHELTHAGPRADRLEMLRHTRAHTGQIFMICPDSEGHLEELIRGQPKEAPATVVTDEYGVVHKLWAATGAVAGEFVACMEEKQLVIADGHHRYETALAYRDECRLKNPGAGANAPHERVMMTIFSARGTGLVILPTHRLVSGIVDFDFVKFRHSVQAMFDWYAYPFTDDGARQAALGDFCHDFEARARTGSLGRKAIGVYAGEKLPGSRAFYLFVLKRDVDLATLLPDVPAEQRQLDVVLLHGLLLERGLAITAEDVERGRNVSYERELGESIAAVDEGRAQLAFLVNPVRVEQVLHLALAGQVLPQKTTDFYPKLLSGIAIYKLDG